MGNKTRWVLLLVAVVFLWRLGRDFSMMPVEEPPPPPPRVESVEVTVGPVPDVRGGPEMASYTQILAERMLLEMENVVAWSEGYPIPLAFHQGVGTVDVEPWRLTLTLLSFGERVEVLADLCDPEGRCSRRKAKGLWEFPGAPLGELMEGIASDLGRQVPPTLHEMSQPESGDSYARLYLGRAAAWARGRSELRRELEAEGLTFEEMGRRRDPRQKAAYLDPDMETAQWILVEALLADGRSEEALERMLIHDPGRPLWNAQMAAFHMRNGDAHGARGLWDKVRRLAPEDQRFAAQHARALLTVGDLDEGEPALAWLVEHYGDDQAVEQLQVESELLIHVAQSRRGVEVVELDVLPLRHMVVRLAAQGQHTEALEMAEEMRGTVPDEPLDRLLMALAAERGDMKEVKRLASELGEEQVLVRFDDPEPGADVDPLHAMDLAQTAAKKDDWVTTMAWLRVAMADDPWWPEALDLKAQALQALGQTEEATELKALTQQVDPLFVSAP